MKKIKLSKNQSFNKIQAKESDYLYIQKSGIPNSGMGLFTAIDIYKDEIISIFKGEILTNIEAQKRAAIEADGYFVQMLNGETLDSMHVPCFAKYANDAKGYVTSGMKGNSKITLDDSENVCLIATRNIATGEEIFCSYGQKYWKNFERYKEKITSASN